MMTRFGLNVEKTRRRAPEPPVEKKLLADLQALLPKEAMALEAPGVPGILICHRGRALGLHLLRRGDRLSHAQTNQFVALREAGMRIEVARDAVQAMAVVREMGVPLKEEARHTLRDVFRQETRRRK
ncbi:MAG: hypothetical protein U1E93_05330 [Alphaproteobacteria bacterium]